MTKPDDDWKVLPHGPLTKHDDSIWSVTGEISMPLVTLPRRMTIVRLSGSRLLIYSAIALDAATLAAVEALGTPAFLVVPNDHHRLDAPAWKRRYPALVVVAPEGARDKVAEVVMVDTSMPDLADPDTRLVPVAGTRGHEVAIEVAAMQGITLVLNDVVANIRHESGFGGWLLRVAGFAGDTAHVPAPVQMMMVADKAALRAQLLEWASVPGLRRIIVAHGDVIEQTPQQVLRELAHSLS